MTRFSETERRELINKISEEIKKTGKDLVRYEGYADKRSSDYGDGWNNAIDQFVLSLLGRKEQQGGQLLIQAVSNLPSSSKEITCEFCDEYAVEMTSGADPVCTKCGDEILEE